MVSCVQKSSQENNNKAPANSANKAYDLILVPNLIDLLYFCKSGNNKKKLLDKEKEHFFTQDTTEYWYFVAQFCFGIDRKCFSHANLSFLRDWQSDFKKSNLSFSIKVGFF